MAVTLLILSCALFSWDWFCAVVSAVSGLLRLALQWPQELSLLPDREMLLPFALAFADTWAPSPTAVFPAQPAGAALSSPGRQAVGIVEYHTLSGRIGHLARAA